MVNGGLKATSTDPVWPPTSVNGLPEVMLNGRVVATLPVKLKLPKLMTWNSSVLVRPVATAPKF